ncbi:MULTISPECIES: SLAP domain-containing protein [unclassified Lactobacillus]|uniref:SLAP domain-containing protein n=1 Tax=unclassified Lactobacillus TaxID=2620435 RepID=UPI002269E2C7|nr:MULTISPECIES: SLAP domain-containing protein [unclassified Lactobacillus]MCX8720259.1 SLAP domain-containing protein [Lactobacillus sp. B4010]MCX8732922.1 SLAP domain-containing protein [Lactobacillus sp. B4015]MCX8735025.1 SLAP domain-containing protein [Lactobacillus sp. B4012]
MNLNKKIIFGSIASFLALSPIVPAVLTPSPTVQAAKATTFKLNHNSYVYNAHGKRTYYQGQKTLKMGATVNGTNKISTIKGSNYYPLTGGTYIKAANVGAINNQIQPGNLELNYNSYVYDKDGKRLTKFRGSKSNTHLLKGTPVKYSGTVEKTDRDSKQYFLLDDDNYNQSWLPYEKIGTKYYYNIGGGGYINAANVEKIDNKPLYTAEATVTINAPMKFVVGYGKEKVMVKPGQKVKVDRVSLIQYDPSTVVCFRLSGTKTGFFAKKIAKKQPRQKLLTYTFYDYILNTDNINVYDINGQVRTNLGETFDTGDKIPVDEELYIWQPKENKAELFYHIARNGDTIDSVQYGKITEDYRSYIKVTGTSHISGPQLTPINTAEEAKADAKVATRADKTDLQKLIDQDKVVKANENYQKNGSKFYDRAIKNANEINDSNTASIAEVKQAARLLKQQLEEVFLPIDQLGFNWTFEDAMPI